MGATPHTPDDTASGATIRDVEIFRAGDYGDKGAYSEADLERIAASYSETTHPAPVTVDHAQTGPALGWVEKVRRVGRSLYADFVRVAPEFADAIRRKAFRTRSVELYREFPATAGPYLKAVTFLGCASPHVKGMADVPAFSDASAAIPSVSLPGLDFLAFGEFPKPPRGVPSFGVLSREAMTGSLGGHYHGAVLDSEGNGYTTGPIDDYAGGMPGSLEPRSGHQHAILAGVVQPAGDPPHTHDLTLYDHTTTRGETDAKEMASMSEPTTPAPGNPTAPDPALAVAKFAEIEAENAALKASLEAAKSAATETEKRLAAIEAARFSEREASEFASGFDAAVRAGKASPAERASLFATFSALPREDEKVVKFGDKSLSHRENFLAGLGARPAVARFGDMLKDAPPVPDENLSPADAKAKARIEFAEAKLKDPHFSGDRADAIALAMQEIK